ncbi:MAG: hypothetical protein ACR2MY_03070 [Candidatus Dormibacteria bacterium]
MCAIRGLHRLMGHGRAVAMGLVAVLVGATGAGLGSGARASAAGAPAIQVLVNSNPFRLTIVNRTTGTRLTEVQFGTSMADLVTRSTALSGREPVRLRGSSSPG